MKGGQVGYFGRDVGLGESGYKGRGREGIEVGWRLEGRVYGDKGGGASKNSNRAEHVCQPSLFSQ